MKSGPAGRRLGAALLAFGLAGVVLLGAASALVLGSLNAIDQVATGFDRQRTELVGMLRPASASLRNAAASASNAGASLATTSDAADRAGQLATNLADSFDGLAALGTFEIFGARPFAGLSAEFGAVSGDARLLATDLRTVSESMRTNATDAASVAADLTALATQLESLASSLGSPGTPESGATPAPGTAPPTSTSSIGAQLGFAKAVVVGLLAWLAVPAVASTVVGWRLYRTRPA